MCSTASICAQQPSGLWILTHVKALQPVYTMVEIDGAFELAGDEPQDSSFLYNSGLMTIEFQKTNAAISHSWDGEEGWSVKLDKKRFTSMAKGIPCSVTITRAALYSGLH